MLIPRKPKKSRQAKRDWFDKKKIKEPVKKELAEKTKALIEKKSKSQMKEVVFSYMCPGCKSSFSAGNLQTRIIEAARRGDSYISCPKCGVSLVADRLLKIGTKRSSKVNRAADLISVYPNQGINITPEYAPQTWVDRALLEKIAHELGKYCQTFGFFNPQLKFQRGIRGKVSVNAPDNIKAAEFTVEAVDDYDLRFRVVAAAGITPAGKVVLPKYFMTLDGREIPFTKEAVAEFLSGKVFGPVDPKPVVPELHYKDRDPVRFREIVASRKKKAGADTPVEFWLEELIDETDGKGIKGQSTTIKDRVYTITNVVKNYLPDEYGQPTEWHIEGEVTDTIGKLIKTFTALVDTIDGVRDFHETKIAKKAAGTPTPGQTVEYQGKNYTIDSITGDAAILTDEAGVQTAPVPNADLNIQFEAGAMPAEISAPTLADRINKLVKRSLRDEKTLVPFTDPDPDYSVAKQTDVDPDFSVPYKDSDQGILSEEERAVQKMFRGGSSIKPIKTAAEIGQEEEKVASIRKTADFTITEKDVEDFASLYLDREVVYTDELIADAYNWGLDQDIKEEELNEYATELANMTMDFLGEKKVRVRGDKQNIKKTAEPTGYHQTDDTGKVIELSRLRTLVQDYARAGQLPLDFDLTKVMSEVSRMTRKELEDILDKKQKGQHYPVVHAKREKKAQTSFYANKLEAAWDNLDELEILLEDIQTEYDAEELKVSRQRGDESYMHELLGDLEGVKDRIKELKGKEIVSKISSKSTNAIVREIRKAELTEEDVKKDIKEEEEGEKHYNQMAKEVDSPKTEKVLKDMADEEAEHAEDLEEVVLPAVKNKENYLEKYDSRKKKAQEEEIEEEEKPKTTLKELKTKPHGRPAPEEVAEAPAAAPELQTVFNEVKQHQQRLTEIKAIITEARRKTEEEIRKIQEEQGSVEEAAELQEGIEKLSSLIEQSESQIADLGEFFVWLDTESKTKKFKPTDKWRVEKLLEKFGKDAEEYLTKAERGASSLDTEIEQRLLTVFPKLPKDKEGSIQKKADVLSAITELGSGLWNYVKSISGLLAEGEQLELAL